MYQTFFGLGRMPFETVPDPSFLFLSPAHIEALAALEYGIESGTGFIMLTGGVGLGKTTIIRALLDKLADRRITPIYVFHPEISFDELLLLLCEELEIGDPEATRLKRVQRVQLELIARYTKGERIVLIIDEAQKLPLDTLESLRLLSNLETPEAKLIQIILSGQPELEQILKAPRFRQFDQRIEIKARLQPFTIRQSLDYIRYRLKIAGAEEASRVLTKAAQRRIARRAEGVPRRINILCNLTLLDAFGADSAPAGTAAVRHALLNDRPRTKANGGWRRIGAAAAFTALGAGLMLALFAAWRFEPIRWPPPSPPAMALSKPPEAPPRENTDDAPSPAQAAEPPKQITVPLTMASAPPAEPAPPAPAVEPPTRIVAPLAVTAPLPAAPAETPAPPADTENVVTVQAGDTLLHLIHRIYGNDGDAMMKQVQTLNQLPDANLLLPGRKLRFPAQTPPAGRP